KVMKYLAGILALIVLVGVVVFALYRWNGNKPPPVADLSQSDQDPRLTYDTPLRNVRPDVKYVGDQACASCHFDKMETYRRHPMGRSLAPIAQVASQQEYDKKSGNPFEALGFQFLVERRGDQVVH